jgi:hypothetical protein
MSNFDFRSMNRRHFCALGSAAAYSLQDQLARAASSKNRPNILYCLADDWSFGHAGVYGDPVIQTPTFDRVARQGVLFTHAFSAAPTCTASRGAMLTGQAPHRLNQGANLFSSLPKELPVYPEILEAAGYHVGYTRKGWSPGDVEASGRTRNPAGPRFDNFAGFLKAAPADKPFSVLDDLSRALRGEGSATLRLEFLRGDYARSRRVTVQLGTATMRSGVAA